MNNNIERIKKEFSLSPDLIVKEIPLKMRHTINVIYLETVCSSDKINDYILKIILNNKDKINKKNIFTFLAGANTKKIDNIDQVEYFITNGFVIILIDKLIFAVECKGDLNRSVSTPEVEMSINGPKDAFTENSLINIGLIKRRIKSHNLKIENRLVGRLSNTSVGIIYIENIADNVLVNDVVKKIEQIDIDGIVDSSSLAYLIDNEDKSLFPTIKYTERPDEVATELLRGKIAIVVDTTCFVLIIPSFFIDFINPDMDNYSKSKNVNYIKILRLITFFIAIMTPSIYNALLCFNPESIPKPLLINLSIQREGVPFPLIIETFIMLIICDILKQSDLRFPSKYGTAISILGAIILGQATVDAGIVSPIVIIVIAITFIASLSFTDMEISNAIRYFCFLFLLISAFFGLFGVFISFMIFLIYICKINTFNKPYFAPIAPFNKTYFFNTVFKKSINKDIKRSKLFARKNYYKKEKS